MNLHLPDSPLAGLLRERNARGRLLIVDDHPMSLKLAELTFEPHFEVITADNGPMALRLCQQQAPDLVLLDIDMPDMDGFEVCRRLKSNEATRDIAVIFLTAQADEVQETRGLGLFAVDFIAKPLHAAVALARVNTHLLVKLQADAIRKLVFLDGLSGIYNRRFFDQQLVVEMARSVRNSLPLALILLDVDFFKLFNDHYGHQAGDDCLREIASALKASLRRPADLVARYGGEEFACILPETDFPGAMAIARLLEDRIRKKFIPHPRSAVDSVVTISLGVAVRSGFTLHHATELLATADEQLYHAKHTGRGRACGKLMGAPAPS